MEREPWGADTAEPWVPEPPETQEHAPEYATVSDVLLDLKQILEYVDGDFGADGVQVADVKDGGYFGEKPDRLVILLTNGQTVELRAEVIEAAPPLKPDSRISEN